MRDDRIPRLTINGVVLMEHEQATVMFLQSVLREDIELIPPSHTPHVKMPDFVMSGLMWEMKSPVVSERRAIERMFYEAGRQSNNLVFDLRRIKGRHSNAMKALEKCFYDTRRIRSLYVITKSGELKTYKK